MLQVLYYIILLLNYVLWADLALSLMCTYHMATYETFSPQNNGFIKNNT